MINTVRNTVMAVLNKDNNGYVTPQEFNLFAKQAQLEVFEEYFYSYNNWVNKKNGMFRNHMRQSNSGYADIPKQLAEVIDTFSLESTALANVVNVFTLPTDWYDLITVNYNNIEVERVSQNKILNLISSSLTTPTTAYPAYTLNGATSSVIGNSITVYPATITTGVTTTYVRYPLDPKWTYSTTLGGSPIFDQSAGDYQDFELPESDQVTLVLKILQYAGINIREAEVTQFAGTEEAITDKNES
jgi:hypothetical protein